MDPIQGFLLKSGQVRAAGKVKSGRGRGHADRDGRQEQRAARCARKARMRELQALEDIGDA